ncbi:MAG: arylamine N-acetyltransferase, partial [Deltaproteobacteria bacterium]|nr:arylamine N-acetyltransferase [Nannocystaceae bacterium]
LLHVLATLGFEVVPISARVRLQRPRDFIPPRTHMFLRVEIERESWLADVGVGGLSPTCALRLDTSAEQPTPHEPRRIVREEGRWFHQAHVGGEWTDVCEFTLEQMPPIDREVANWFTSAHPASQFRNRLLVARSGPDAQRHTLLNTQLSWRSADGLERREIADPDELLLVLHDVFGLRFAAGTRFACEALPWR